MGLNDVLKRIIYYSAQYDISNDTDHLSFYIT